MRFLTIIFIFISSVSSGQELTFKGVDSTTYFQFNDHQYSELKKTGKEALHQKIDFYYLRMRLGIAYYEDKNFEQALPNFERANGMNPADTTAQEYLYYTYLFSGRTEDANSFVSNLQLSMQEKLHYKKKTIDVVSISGGLSFTDNITSREKSNIKGAENIYGGAIYNGRVKYANAFLQHTILNRLKFMYGASAFNTQAVLVVQTTDTAQSQQFDNYHYQGNFAAFYQFKKGWNLTGGFAYYQQNISGYLGQTDSTTKQLITMITRQNSYAGCLSISKRLKFIQPIVSSTISNFNDSIQYIGEASIVYYPFGNTNFYSTSSAAYLKDGTRQDWIFSQKFGGKIKKWLWYEVNSSYGNHSNFITNTGFLTYNTSDQVKLVVGLNLKFYRKHLEFIPGYIYNQRQGTFSHLTSQSLLEPSKYNYSIHLFTTTLKWNF